MFYTWRKHKSHRDETQAVKEALRKARLPFRKVCHGSGTAWGWLHIYAGENASRETCDRILRVAQEVTGRHGDYQGEILVQQ